MILVFSYAQRIQITCCFMFCTFSRLRSRICFVWAFSSRKYHLNEIHIKILSQIFHNELCFQRSKSSFEDHLKITLHTCIKNRLKLLVLWFEVSMNHLCKLLWRLCIQTWWVPYLRGVFVDRTNGFQKSISCQRLNSEQCFKKKKKKLKIWFYELR